MSFAKSMPHYRSRAQLEPARRIERHPVLDLHAAHDRGRVVAYARDDARSQRRPAALLARNLSAFAHFASEVVPNLLLAVVSWIMAEALAGCAAYAEALYPLPRPLEPDEPLPVAMPPHMASAGLAAAKPSLSLIHSKDDFVRREPRLPAGLPARTAAMAVARGDQSKASRSPWYVPLGVFVAACWSRIRKEQERRQAIAELRGLDDRALRDIGLSYSDIEYVIRNGAGRE